MATAPAGAPSVAVHGWLAFMAVTGMVAGAMYAIYQLVRIANRAMQTVARFEAVLPTLIGIGEDFKRNGGSTLRDRIEKIDRTQDGVAAAVASTQSEVAALYAYTHERMHALTNGLTKVTSGAGSVEQLAKVLGETANELRALRRPDPPGPQPR